MKRDYYVYAHATSEGDVFYVGKGCGDRIHQTGNRSLFWKRMVAKHGLTKIKLSRGLSEEQSFAKEVDTIAYYKSIGMCRANMTLGGDGVRVAKRWWGKKISNAMRGRVKPKGAANKSFKPFATKEQLRQDYIVSNIGLTEMAHKYGVSIPTVAERLHSFGIPVRAAGRSKISIHCTTDGKSFEAMSSAASHYGIFRENIRKVLRGEYKTTGGLHFTYAKV